MTQLESALQDLDPETDEAPAQPAALVSAYGVAAGAVLTRSRIGAELLSPGDGYGLAATFYSVPLPVEDLPEEQEEADDETASVGGRPASSPTTSRFPAPTWR